MNFCKDCAYILKPAGAPYVPHPESICTAVGALNYVTGETEHWLCKLQNSDGSCPEFVANGKEPLIKKPGEVATFKGKSLEEYNKEELINIINMIADYYEGRVKDLRSIIEIRKLANEACRKNG